MELRGHTAGGALSSSGKVCLELGRQIWVVGPWMMAEASTTGRVHWGSMEREKSSPGNERLGQAEKITKRLIFALDL